MHGEMAGKSLAELLGNDPCCIAMFSISINIDRIQSDVADRVGEETAKSAKGR